MISYITRKRYKKKCIQGDVNLPYNTECFCNENGLILYNNKPVCYNTSQDAFDYFARNDDGNGLERAQIIENILSLTRNDLAKDKDKRDRIWEYLWNNEHIKNAYKREDHDDVWLWNFNFYNAPIFELRMILNTIKDK